MRKHIEIFLEGIIEWGEHNIGAVITLTVIGVLVGLISFTVIVQQLHHTAMVEAGDCQFSHTYTIDGGTIVARWYCNGIAVTQPASEEHVRAYIDTRDKRIKDGTWY